MSALQLKGCTEGAPVAGVADKCAAAWVQSHHCWSGGLQSWRRRRTPRQGKPSAWRRRRRWVGSVSALCMQDCLCRLPGTGSSGLLHTSSPACSHPPHPANAPCLNHACAPTSRPPPAWCQVSRTLFEKLKLPPPPCAKELKSGGYSTGQEVGRGRPKPVSRKGRPNLAQRQRAPHLALRAHTLAGSTHSEATLLQAKSFCRGPPPAPKPISLGKELLSAPAGSARAGRAPGGPPHLGAPQAQHAADAVSPAGWLARRGVRVGAHGGPSARAAGTPGACTAARSATCQHLPGLRLLHQPTVSLQGADQPS